MLPDATRNNALTSTTTKLKKTKKNQLGKLIYIQNFRYAININDFFSSRAGKDVVAKVKFHEHLV